MKVHKFNQYSLYDSMSNDFINSFDALILESDSTIYKKVEKKLISDLKLKIEIITMFGASFGGLYPIVESLLKNMNVRSIQVTPESVVLLTISALTIVYLEEKKFKSSKEQDSLTRDSKSMLEELKMMGIGNGLVKKLIQGLKSIKNIFSLIGKYMGAVIGGVIDMFAYIAIFIPIMNGILSIVNKYDLNLDTLPENFLGLAVGIGTIIARHGITEIIGKLKNKFPKLNKKKIIDELGETPVHKFSTFTDEPTKKQGELIKEEQ